MLVQPSVASGSFAFRSYAAPAPDGRGGSRTLCGNLQLPRCLAGRPAEARHASLEATSLCLQWVAEVAVELAGGPATPMLPGREDCGCFDNANIIADECAPATDLVSFWSEPRFILLPTTSASSPCTYHHAFLLAFILSLTTVEYPDCTLT